MCVGDSPQAAAFTFSVGGGDGSVTTLQTIPVPWKMYHNVSAGTFTGKCECVSLGCKCSSMCASLQYQVKQSGPSITLSSTAELVGLALEGDSCGGVPDLPQLRGCTGYVTQRRIVPWPVASVETCLQSSRAEYPSGSSHVVTLSCLLKKRRFPTLRVGDYSNCTAYESLASDVGTLYNRPRAVFDLITHLLPLINCTDPDLYVDGTLVPAEYCRAARNLMLSLTSPNGACYKLAMPSTRQLTTSSGSDMMSNRRLMTSTPGCSGNPKECSSVTDCRVASSTCDTDPKASAIGTAAVTFAVRIAANTFLASQINALTLAGALFFAAEGIPIIIATAVGAVVVAGITKVITTAGKKFCEAAVRKCLVTAKATLDLDCRGVGCCMSGEPCPWPCKSCSEVDSPPSPLQCDAAHSTKRCNTCIGTFTGCTSCGITTSCAPYYTYEWNSCYCPKYDCGVLVSCAEGGCPFFPLKSQCSSILA